MSSPSKTPNFKAGEADEAHVMALSDAEFLQWMQTFNDGDRPIIASQRLRDRIYQMVEASVSASAGDHSVVVSAMAQSLADRVTNALIR